MSLTDFLASKADAKKPEVRQKVNKTNNLLTVAKHVDENRDQGLAKNMSAESLAAFAK